MVQQRYSQNLYARLHNWLFTPVPSVTLALLRIGFGLIICWQFLLFKQIFDDYIPNTEFNITYPYLSFIRPLGEPWFSLSFIFFMLASLLFAAGYRVRITGALILIGCFYYFHIDETIYNNHYYLYILISFIFLFTASDSSLKLGKSNLLPVPRWQVFLLQFQLLVLYFFGGVAKLNSEWLLQAEPVRTWLPDMLGPTVFGWLSDQQRLVAAYSIAYSGLMLDLCAGFLLFSSRTRRFIIPVLLLFHASNAIFFNIGTFPFFGMLSIVIFLDPQKVLAKLNDWKLVTIAKKQTAPLMATSTRDKWVICFVVTYMFVQVVLPLRHFAIPGNVLWDERAYKFSWFMKLRSKDSIVALKVKIDGDPLDYFIDLNDYKLTKKQFKYIFTKPLVAVTFAKQLEQRIKDNNKIAEDIKIYPEFYIKLNAYNYQLLMDTGIDLTSINQPLIDVNDYPWIMKFNPDAPPFDYNNPLRNAYPVKDEFIEKE